MKSYTHKKAKEFLKMKKCRYCRSTENLTIDHKVPIIQGGTDDFGNLQCLCKNCNQMKSGLSHRQVMNLFNWFVTFHRYRKLIIEEDGEGVAEFDDAFDALYKLACKQHGN
jgi:hypothetical protein